MWLCRLGRLRRLLFRMRLRRFLWPLRLWHLVLPLGLRLRRLRRLVCLGLLGVPRIGVLVAHRASPSCTANSTARSRASPKPTGSVPEVPA